MRAGLSAALVCLLLSACEGSIGTISVGFVTSPGSDLLTRTERVEMRLTGRDSIFEATRDEDGRLFLDFDVKAAQATDALSVALFDAAGTRIGNGRSGPLPLASIDATVRIFVAPPESISPAPVELPAPLTEPGGTAVDVGALITGGRIAGAPVPDLRIYNIYTHEFQDGLALPESVAHPTVLSGEIGGVFVFGGTRSDGMPSALATRFDTRAAPMGAYTPLNMPPEFARERSSGATIAPDQFLITGTPPLLLDGVASTVTAFAGAPGLPNGVAAALADSDEVVVVGLGGGATGAVLLTGGQFSELPAPASAQRTGHTAVLLPEQALAFVGGDVSGTPAATALRYRAGAALVEELPGIPAVPRIGAAVAATDRFLVIAGGEASGGGLVGTAELYDALTLAPVATIPLVTPRRDAIAIALANGQILIAGGTNALGQPLATLELFTPAEET